MLLVHACCAQCISAPAEALAREGVDFTALYYNPNIQPYQEFVRRREALEGLSRLKGFGLQVTDEYDVASWLENAKEAEAKHGVRCRYCYEQRLRQAAEVASELGCEGFTTTLLSSPFQKHDLVREVASEMERKFQVPFVYRDFREMWPRTYEIMRDTGLYRQKYCGCVFSEEERSGKD